MKILLISISRHAGGCELQVEEPGENGIDATYKEAKKKDYKALFC